MRLKSQARQPEIPQFVLAMFTGEIRRADLSPEDLRTLQTIQFYDDPGTPREMWAKYAETLIAMAAERTPGSRPRGWWDFAAPLASDDLLKIWRISPEFYRGHGKSERPRDPRLRMGGIGTPKFEVLAHAPAFSYGIPYQWVSQWDVDYYNGRARDIHGKIIASNFKEGDFKGVAIDPMDPPQFESQAAYLKRHGLFMPGEERRLSAKDFEPESVHSEKGKSL